MSWLIRPCFFAFWQVQSWIFAYIVLAYVLWLLCPAIHFPKVLLEEAEDRGASGTTPYPNNFFEVLIFQNTKHLSSGSVTDAQTFESLPKAFTDVNSNIGSPGFSDYFLYALTQV